MTPVIRVRKDSGQEHEAGFTLLEILVSFALLSIAFFILIAMFRNSMDLGSSVSHRRVATRIAEEVLTDMRNNPASYKWPKASDQLQVVASSAGEIGTATPPTLSKTALVPDDAINKFYKGFSWRAYVKQAPDAAVCELTVVVFWTDSGRSQRYTLTSLAPRRVLDGKS